MGRDQKGGRQGSGKPGGAGRDHRPRNPESVLTRYDVIHLDDHMTMNVRRRRRNMLCCDWTKIMFLLFSFKKC